MQKDFHFYVTFTLARKAGLSADDAEKVAWANQYTDEMKDADLYGIQTQSAVLGNWDDRQVQMSVLAPFHFIPGTNNKNRWVTERNCPRARELVEFGMQNDIFQFGIALHAYQDTFSHENFSGWRESINSCFPWYYLKSGLPNVGHTEMMATPDVIHYKWTDPRTGVTVDNKIKAIGAAKGTFDFMVKYANSQTAANWSKVRSMIYPFFKLNSYDTRIDKLCAYSGNSKIDFKNVNKKFEKKYKRKFIKAALNHLSKSVELFRDLQKP